MSDGSYYLKSRDEMATVLGMFPGALDNTLLVAEMCDVNLKTKGYHLPVYPVPEGHTAESFLRRLCAEGLIAFARGDIAAARAFLKRAAENGDPRALMALGDTYDPTNKSQTLYFYQ